MVVVNGYVQGIELSGGGFNEYGEPTQPTLLAGELIPCNISSLSHTKQGTATDSKYDTFSAQVLIDLQDFTAQRVNLFDTYGNQIAKDVQVQDTQVLEFVDALQITIQ